MKLLSIFVAVLLVNCAVLAQEVWLHPNNGQWDDRIEYKVELDLGEMLIEKDKFTYNLTDIKIHHHKHQDHENDEEIAWHVIKTSFVDSDWSGEVIQSGKSEFYRNYIIGNDQSKWKGHVYSYKDLTLKNYYPGIDLLLDGDNGLKYSFVVRPGIEANVIKMHYEGQDRLMISEDGSLHIANRFGEITESAPLAWLQESGANVEVAFELLNDTIVFHFPNGYDKTETLIIDPSLVFSSYTGAGADNWGMTATPDENGNLFAGGIVFGFNGYPTTTGAFQTVNVSGMGNNLVDMGITKFTADGSSLIYSTYLGGVGSETPHSLIANSANELFVFGVTSSNNFPMAGSSFDNTYAGGPGSIVNNINFSSGSDLFVARLSADGSTLIASTYVGGSGTDGLNLSPLEINYGDQYRGEITLDQAGNVLISSTTQSVDFPTQFGTQGALSGQQDAVLFKMPPTLSSLTWSTFFGGTGYETGNSIQVAANGDVYVAGGTTSPAMPFFSGYDISFGGVADGYLARFNAANGAILTGTFIGLGERDQAFFVQLDIDDKVYVLGQTESDLGITGGLYGNPNSGQFIHKFNHNLTALEWKTMVGASSGHVEISPTAFLVSDCYDIYFSGWGGQVNISNGFALNSTTNGFPVTVDAYQPTTNGSNFYIGVLSANAGSLKYGTFFGGTSSLSPEHVDGGTSRFDKSGRIYHAVCGGCGANSGGFTTTPGAWSNQNGSNNCNLAAFKFELNVIEAIVSTPSTVVCLPSPVIFNNNSANGNTFFWDFGDNNTSTAVNPSHVYPGAGTYNVTLVVTDSNQCFSPDSVEFVVHIGDFNGGIVPLPGPVCPNEPVQLEAYGGANYLWSPAQFLDNPNIYNPVATVASQQEFMVIISDSCGVDTAYVTVDVFGGGSTISDDVTVCIGQSTQLQATGGGTYSWTPTTFLNNPNIASPICTPTNAIQYTVDIVSPEGCTMTETVNVGVDFNPPVPVMPDTVRVCENSTVEISVSGGEIYNWSPNQNISAIDTNVVTITASQSMYYYCIFSNSCGSVLDSVYVEVVKAEISAFGDTIMCPGETATIWAEGGVSYAWSPISGLSSPQANQSAATPLEPTNYVVTGIDTNGCIDTDTVFVDLYPKPYVYTSPDAYVFYDDDVHLYAYGSSTGTYSWSPTENLTCVNCTNPIATPNQNFTYMVEFIDENGCVDTDLVNIFYDPILYIPNTFTPGDGDEFNNTFHPEGGNIREFEMEIYNRWGQLIYTLEHFRDSWDGTYKGVYCQDGTYTWKAKFKDLEGVEHVVTGHVNLIR